MRKAALFSIGRQKSSTNLSKIHAASQKIRWRPWLRQFSHASRCTKPCQREISRKMTYLHVCENIWSILSRLKSILPPQKWRRSQDFIFFTAGFFSRSSAQLTYGKARSGMIRILLTSPWKNASGTLPAWKTAIRSSAPCFVMSIMWHTADWRSSDFRVRKR